MIQVSRALSELDWIPRPKLTALRRLGIETVEDLATHFPLRHEDRRAFAGFPREESDVPICLCGQVMKTQLIRFGGWKKIFEATLQESNANALSQPLVLRWFNLHYVQKMIATGQRLVVFGKPRLRGQRLCMEHPEFEVIENDDEISVHFRRITPIYPATEGLSQRVFRGLVYRALEDLDEDSVETSLPRNVDLGSRSHALHEIHFPSNEPELAAAREHLVFSEFFGMQMLIAARRSAAALRSGEAHCGDGALMEIRPGARQEERGPLPLFDLARTQTLGSAGCQPAVSGSLPDTSAGADEPRYNRRRLPHFERPWAKYMITFSTREKRSLSGGARSVVLKSILRWKDHRYGLFAACVMPDHVH